MISATVEGVGITESTLRLLRSASQRTWRNALCDARGMETPGERLKWARQRAGFEKGTDAARARGWVISTYLGHENGDRVPSRDTAKRYAKAFRVRWEWLLEGEGETDHGSLPIPVIGTISAGGKVSLEPPKVDAAEVPPGATQGMVALVAVEPVMPGVLEQGWIIYCSDRHETVPEGLLGQLCLIGLADGETIVGRLFRGSSPATYDLVFPGLNVARDIGVAWVAKVEWIKPE